MIAASEICRCKARGHAAIFAEPVRQVADGLDRAAIRLAGVRLRSVAGKCNLPHATNTKSLNDAQRACRSAVCQKQNWQVARISHLRPHRLARRTYRTIESAVHSEYALGIVRSRSKRAQRAPASCSARASIGQAERS